MSSNPRSGDRSGEHEFKIRRRPKTPAKPCTDCGTSTPLHLDTCTASPALLPAACDCGEYGGSTKTCPVHGYGGTAYAERTPGQERRQRRGMLTDRAEG